jgi:type I restriction enzyme, R subunit
VNTPAVFGDYIDIYDISRAVEDGATVPIYYESRLARIELDEDEKPRIDAEIEAILEDEAFRTQRRSRRRSGHRRAAGGQRQAAGAGGRRSGAASSRPGRGAGRQGDGVCMSRRICVDLYDQIVKLSPDWHSDDDDKGASRSS